MILPPSPPPLCLRASVRFIPSGALRLSGERWKSRWSCREQWYRKLVRTYGSGEPQTEERGLANNVGCRNGPLVSVDYLWRLGNDNAKCFTRKVFGIPADEIVAVHRVHKIPQLLNHRLV